MVPPATVVASKLASDRIATATTPLLLVVHGLTGRYLLVSSLRGPDSFHEAVERTNDFGSFSVPPVGVTTTVAGPFASTVRR